ncbi:UNVERIFIED_CONTAM: hypothetical protein FKN15_002185 [Acipenser sinensis]
MGRCERDFRFCGVRKHSNETQKLQLNVTRGCRGLSISSTADTLFIGGELTISCVNTSNISLPQVSGLETPFCVYWDGFLDLLRLEYNTTRNFTLCGPSTPQTTCCTDLSLKNNSGSKDVGILKGSVRGDIMKENAQEFYIFKGESDRCDNSVCEDLLNTRNGQTAMKSGREDELERLLMQSKFTRDMQHFELPCGIQTTTFILEPDFKGNTVVRQEGRVPGINKPPSVYIPPTLLSNKPRARKATKVVSSFYNNNSLFQDKNSMILNGDVVGLTVENEVIADLVEPVVFTFFHKKQPQISNQTVHNLEAQTNITYIGCGISALCCVLTIGLFLCQRKYTSNKSSLIHMNLAVALLLLNVSFLLNMTLASLCNEGVCILLALMLHYSLLCSFTWMGIEAYNVYRLLCLVLRTYTSQYMLKLCLVGFVLPAALAIGFASGGFYGSYPITSSTGTETTIRPVLFSLQARHAATFKATASEDHAALDSLQAGLQAPGQSTGVPGARRSRNINKMLYKCVSVHSDWTERLKEIALVCRVRSDRVMVPLGIYRSSLFLGLVSEWMGGGCLHSLLYECQLFPELPVPLLLRILLDVAEGVCHLHSLTPPLLHQALKSSNVLLDTQNRAKVCDYGLSQWRAWNLQSVPADYSGLCSQDLAYLSPETLRGEAPSAKGDVYSFAVLMWETLSRRRPYQDIGQPQDLVSSVQSGVRPDTGEEFIPAAVPQRNSLIQLITKCWHPDPHTRPQIRDCVLELRRVVEMFHPDTLSQAALWLKEMKERALEGCKDQLIHALQIEINNLEISSRNPKNAGNKSVPMETVQMLTSAPVGPDPHRTSPKPPPVPQMGRGIPLEAASQRESCSFASSLPSKPACSRVDGRERRSSPGRCCPGQSPPRPPLHQTDSFSQPEQCTLAWFPERSCCQILQDRRGSIVRGMTEGRLNYVLDRLRSRQALAREDYEYITAALTLAARTRCLLDTCLCLGEGTAQLVVQALGLGSSRALCQ